MPSDEHPGSKELVELAEASLALGDAEAALQLLAQVDEDNRDNRWIATRVWALRMHHDYELSWELATQSLLKMIEDCDWVNAQNVLLEFGRVSSDSLRTKECMDYLHDVATTLWGRHTASAALKVLIIAMLASRICNLGDVRTADQLLALIESEVAYVDDVLALTSVLWVQAEIAAESANVDLAFRLMERVNDIYLAEGNIAALQRSAVKLCLLATSFIEVDRQSLLMAKKWIEFSLYNELGENRSSQGRYLDFHAAHIALKLGDVDDAVERLEMISKTQTLSDIEVVYLQYLLALVECESGNPEQSAFLLDNAVDLSASLPQQVEVKALLRLIAHAYVDLGEVRKSEQILPSISKSTVDLSRYLINL